jgi:hypothetical protein
MDRSRRHPWLQKPENQGGIALSPRHDAMLRHALIILGLSGATLFSVLLALTYVQPITIEKWARTAIAGQVKQRVTERIDDFSNSRIAQTAGRLVKNNEQAIAEQAALRARLQPLIDKVMDRMAEPACPCRLLLTVAMTDIPPDSTGSLIQTNARLTRMIESGYRNVAQSLLNEIRVFSAANGAVLLVLGLLAACWKRPASQLIAPALVMVAALLLTGSAYLFNQDWLQTVLLGDYVGFWYGPYLLLVAGWLADTVFFSARVTRALFTLLSSATPGC